jgi:hypothetical protein
MIATTFDNTDIPGTWVEGPGAKVVHPYPLQELGRQDGTRPPRGRVKMDVQGPRTPFKMPESGPGNILPAFPSFKITIITNPLSLCPVHWLTPPRSGLCTAGSQRSVSTHSPLDKPRRPRTPAVSSIATSTRRERIRRRSLMRDLRDSLRIPELCACPEAQFCGHFHQFALAKPWLTISIIPWHLFSIARHGCQVPGLPVETEMAWPIQSSSWGAARSIRKALTAMPKPKDKSFALHFG